MTHELDLSVIIPSRNEQFLAKTVRDILQKAQTNFEIIVVLEGYWPEGDDLVLDPHVHYVYFPVPRGMRGAINAGVAASRGAHVLKCDAHCMFDEGFDEKLIADLEPDWIAVPTRYSLDPENWTRKQKKPIDYMYLCAPTDPNDYGGPSLHGRVWSQKQNDASLKANEIDDLMSAQGSCWIMHHDYFHELELLDDVNYGHFCFEFQEIGLKCWLSGGRVIRNKKTWYAHLHKGRKYGRGWPLGKSTLDKGAEYSNRWMDGRLWHKQDRDIRWLIKKFWPVPTWTAESTHLVFHRRRGGSGEIRGTQIGKYLLARVNPEWTYPDDVHVWVKQQPPEDYPARSWLDVLDAHERIPWLKQHIDVGVIASSATGKAYLDDVLGARSLLIPQHHCNYDRVRRDRQEVLRAGVVGGRGAIQCNLDELKVGLDKLGVEFVWMDRYTTREEVVEFYKNLDVQLVWRRQNRPLKNPLKLINAASFGIPTIGYPEVGYAEWDGHYIKVQTISDMLEALRELQLNGWNAEDLIQHAEPYHIEKIAPLYRRLLE